MSGQASLFHPVTVYLFFHGLVFVVRPILVLCCGFDSVWQYMLFEPTPEQLMRAIAVSSLALVVFCGACMGFGWCRVGDFSERPRAFTPREKLSLVVTTLLLLPLVLYSVRISNSGAATGKMVGGTYIMTGTTGYINDAQVMGGALICAWLIMTRFRWPALLTAVVYVMYRSYEGYGRWTILLLFLAAALAYAWQRQRLWMPLWSIAGVIPILMLFHALGENRAWFQDVLLDRPLPAVSTENLPEQERLKKKYDTQEYANFDFLTYVVAMVPERTQCYTYGVQYLQLFTEPIPRKLWAGKPIGAPVQFFNLNNYGDFLGLTVSMPGDGWMSGGWVGVIITAGITGLLLGLAHRWFWQKAQRDNILSLLYILGLAMIAQQYRDGGYVSLAKFLMWNWLPLGMWIGCNWLLGPRLMRSEKVLLPRGTRLHLVLPANRLSESQANASGQNSTTL